MEKSSNKVGFYLLYAIAVLLFIEVVLRICFPVPELENFNRINYQILDRQDDRSGYLRNIKMIWKSSLDTNYAFVHQLNKYGYRDEKEWKVDKGNKKRFFFVGDSFVEGMMSTSDKTIPVGFHQEANKNNIEFEGFNCGMMGIGLNEYVKFLKDAVPIYRPDEVFLVMYSNDAPFQRQYNPQERLVARETNIWKPRLLEIIKHLKNEDPIPFRFFPEKRSFYKAVPDPGNPWTVHEASLKQEVTPKIADAMKKGDFNYFRTNWILEEEKFLKSDINIKSKLEFLRNYLEQYSTKLSVFYIPSRSQVSDYYYQFERQACLKKCPDFIDLTGSEYQKHAATIAQNCRELQIPFFDFTPIVRKEEKKGNHLYWNYDDHMRGNSYLMLGRKMYQIWSENQ